jgi:hypothetical protein
MEKIDSRTDEERIFDLEARIEKQEARIEGLVESLAFLVMAHVACHNDARVPMRIAQHRSHDFRQARAGGTRRIDAVFFESRGGLFQDLLNQIRESDFLRTYWIRSIFPKRDEKRLKRIERIEASLAKCAEEQ